MATVRPPSWFKPLSDDSGRSTLPSVFPNLLIALGRAFYAQEVTK
jgi:hypothetical protein